MLQACRSGPGRDPPTPEAFPKGMRLALRGRFRRVSARALQIILAGRVQVMRWLAEDGPNSLLGLPGLPYLAAQLLLETLHCCQKPWRFWLAI